MISIFFSHKNRGSGAKTTIRLSGVFIHVGRLTLVFDKTRKSSALAVITKRKSRIMGTATTNHIKQKTMNSPWVTVKPTHHPHVWTSRGVILGGGGVLDIMHARGRMNIDPRIPTNAGTEKHTGFSPTKRTLLIAASAERREVFGEVQEG